MTTPGAVAATPLPRPTSRANRFRRRQGWVVGVAVLLAVLVFWRYSQIPAFGPFEVRGIVAGTMTLALLAMAQTVIVISGGIDLSVGAMMVLANCIAARLMLDQDLGPVVLVAIGVVAVAMILSGLIGLVTVVSGVPDIVVTLAASFILAGLALIVLDGLGVGTAHDTAEWGDAGSATLGNVMRASPGASTSSRTSCATCSSVVSSRMAAVSRIRPQDQRPITNAPTMPMARPL